ncbi:momilactone A synthase-like isoform X1 [Zingiber officinale]|uniref:momilactone A synthase-like isoform X1 n=1 Tax=Zingiber officinale TaxID=94328 RepID=UPI001C4AC6F6|nr:momilactone A synthase-like isoform X1 [Zingiber officinale]
MERRRSLITFNLLNFVLEGKVAVITGGASGIGEATVKLFVRHGARVIVADVQDEKGKTLCAGLGSDDVASYVHCDVRLEPDVKRAVDTAISLHGKLDIMFNNAGIVDPSGSSILGEDDTTAVFDRVMGVNVLGALLGTKHAGQAMVAAGRGGSIIFTASLVSVVGGLSPAVYTCSKHAVVGLARSAAAELGKHGVRVNCVSPSMVATPLAESHRQKSVEELETMAEVFSTLKGVRLKAEDIAEAALFLASDESRFVSGHNLMVDGASSVTKTF